MQTTISQNLALFKETKKIRFILRAAMQVIKEKRILELSYGAYCVLLHQPSKVVSAPEKLLQAIIEDFVSQYSYCFFYNREDLIAKFGAHFAVESLPKDFTLTRSESVTQCNGLLIVGEYAENSARIALITKTDCVISNYYQQIRGVRHIHAVHYCETSGNVFISTGDTAKLLDQWKIKERELVFVKRLKKRMAGFTAISKAKNDYFFGTDLSSRPNYIESSDGNKYFFPVDAYYKHCLTFYPVLGHYIATINTSMDEFGKHKILSIFDTDKREFIFCDSLENIIEPYKH
jgi:hypothetical protein